MLGHGCKEALNAEKGSPRGDPNRGASPRQIIVEGIHQSFCEGISDVNDAVIVDFDTFIDADARGPVVQWLRRHEVRLVGRAIAYEGRMCCI
jgi:hypothetical protein